MKYRLLAGKHIQTDSDGVERCYEANQTFETAIDMSRFNRRGVQPKFERILEDGPPRDPLDSMTVAELRVLAEEEEIDVSGAANRADVAEIIRRSRDA